MILNCGTVKESLTKIVAKYSFPFSLRITFTLSFVSFAIKEIGVYLDNFKYGNDFSSSYLPISL